MSRYSIEDAETISRALAGGFEIPPAYVRADLYPGDLATLFFNVEGHLPGEPLRVEVLEIEGPGQYIGRLIEESGDLRFGTPIAFDERKVAWIEPPDRVRMSGIFDIWKGKGEEPPPPPPPPPPSPPSPLPAPSGELLPAEEPYQFPRYPRELQRIPQESYPLPPVFYLPYRPSGMIPVEEEERMLSEFRGEALPLTEFQGTVLPPAPVKENPFAIWNPTAKENLPMPAQEKAGAFSIWEQKELPLAPIEEKAGAFSIWTPPPSQAPIVAPPPEEAGMFSVWNPEAMAAEKAAYKEMDLWEIVVPKAEQGSMYQPEEKEAFDIWQPETPAPMPVAPIKPKKKKKKKDEEEILTEEELEEAVAAAERASAVLDWDPPTVEEVAAILTEALNLKKVWRNVREDRKSPGWLEEQAAAIEDESEGVPIPLHTIVNYEMGGHETLVENLFDFLDLDTGVLQPLFEEYEKTEDEEVWEQLNEVGYELSHLIGQALDSLKPDDIPGRFGIMSHDHFGNQEFIGYVEDPEDSLSPAERRRLQRERELEEKKAEEKREKQLRKLLGSWRPMTWEQAAEFLDVNYGLQNLAQKFRKAKTTKKWKEETENYGGGTSIIEDFGEDDGDLELRVARFLGIPMSLVDRFGDEVDLEALWEAVLYPSFEAIEEAWNNVKPEDLPGDIEATEDESSGFALYYSEPEAYNEGEEDEGEEEED